MNIYTYLTFEYWYDRHYKMWYAAEYDKQRNQKNTAIYAPSKNLILKYIELEVKWKS